jgi:hypothetical protein
MIYAVSVEKWVESVLEYYKGIGELHRQYTKGALE